MFFWTVTRSYRLVVISHSILLQNVCKIISWLHSYKIISWLPSSSCGHFFFNSDWKLIQKLDCLLPPVVISSSVLFQKWCKITSWLPSSSCGHALFNSSSKLMYNPFLVVFLQNHPSVAFLLLLSFLMQFWFKTDTKSFLGCLPHLVVVSYSVPIPNWCTRCH